MDTLRHAAQLLGEVTPPIGARALAARVGLAPPISLRALIDAIVHAPPPVAAIAAQPPTGEAPLAVTLSAVGSTGLITHYGWQSRREDSASGGPIGTGPAVAHTFVESGAHLVSLDVVGPGGADSATLRLIVVPAPLAVHASAAPQQGPAPLAVVLSATEATGKQPHYRWHAQREGVGSGQFIGEGATLAHTFAEPGVYRVLATGTIASAPGVAPTAAGSDEVAVSVTAPGAPPPPTPAGGVLLQFAAAWMEPTSLPGVGQPFAATFAYMNAGQAASAKFLVRGELFDAGSANIGANPPVRSEDFAQPPCPAGGGGAVVWSFPQGLPDGHYIARATIDPEGEHGYGPTPLGLWELAFQVFSA